MAKRQPNHFNCDICGVSIPILGFDCFDWKDPSTLAMKFLRLCRQHKRMMDWHYANVVIPSCGYLWNEYVAHLKDRRSKPWPGEPQASTLGPNLPVDMLRSAQ